MKQGCESNEARPRRSIELPVLSTSNSTRSPVAVSRTAKWRAAALIALNCLMAIHIIQWVYTGRTVSPIEPSETMFTLQNGAVNAGAIFFAAALIATLVFGRFVCGWGCHVVSLQDLCAWLLKKMGMTPRPFRSRLLVFVPLVIALYMFVWPTVARWLSKPKDAPLFPQFTNHLITTEFWATFPPVAVAIPFLFICGFVVVYFLGSKGFCTYGCPYGGFFGVLDKAAPGRIRVTDACNECGHCTAVCTSNVIVHREVKEFGMVVDPGCMKCMDCVSVCPNDALYFGFGKPALAAKGKLSRTYSLTWPEEIAAAVVFAASLFAVWDVYQLVPMLMALGIAIVSTYLFMRLVKIVRSGDAAFYRWTLRSAGRMTSAGWLFAAFAVVWLGLNAHSGFIRYYELSGARSFESLKVPDELALAQADPVQWISAADRAAIDSGRHAFGIADRYGLFSNGDALAKLGWFEFLSGDAAAAVSTLERAAASQPAGSRVLSRYYRGVILDRIGRFDEGEASLNAALAERDDLVAAREELGVSLWRQGRRTEAAGAWRDALAQNPDLVMANYFMAGAAAASLDAVEADRYERIADGLAPKEPFFQWMLGVRLNGVGMTQLADKRFQMAIQMDPRFRSRKRQ
ncbi:MAG: 4Fe-4S binding protein [Acidobacteria bacterium]|nr:4Fe-4S binding protein [Acidobacteriota bacterium]MCW5948226.1 4Fe-4S binding protein [Pyrinomonadaceae bacterium]